MPDALAGLRDKIYWRPTSPGMWHAFKRVGGGGYRSLCARAERERSGGQGCGRPPTWLRCGRCDGLEIERRYKNESLPESHEWRDYAP